MNVRQENIVDKEEFIKAIFDVDDTSYLTHNYHPWAAKFIPQIPRYFIERLTKKSDTVYDPFCGSGTTLVEALLLGRNAIGNDINYIASLASKAKTTPLSPEQIRRIATWRDGILALQKRCLDGAHGGSVEDYTGEVHFNNKFHWFDKDVLVVLMQIKKQIESIDDPAIKTFLLAAFSSIVVRVSRQESETRYAAIEKKVEIKDVFDIFLKKLDDMIQRMRQFAASVDKGNWVQVSQADTRTMSTIPAGSVQLVLTSPPYANTYDYYLYHKLRMYLLDYDVKHVRENEIGSRNRYSSQKQDIETFLADMQACFDMFHKILKKTGYVVLIMGDSVVAKSRHSGLDMITEVANRTKFSVLQAFSYKLDDISKLFNKSFRQENKSEWVIILSNNDAMGKRNPTSIFSRDR
ncbi:MAG: DNA methyltransferase [Candidatus Sigynarchaeum springense]